MPFLPCNSPPSLVPLYHHLEKVTGGQGYIGSHTVLRMLEEGYTVSVFDNSLNSTGESLVRVKELVGAANAERLFFFDVDLCDRPGLAAAMAAAAAAAGSKAPDQCIHFAGLKAVGESTRKPLLYHQNNVTGTLNLLEALEGCGCKQLVFSSSATVYGAADVMPITEDTPVGAGITNPYGQSKFLIEKILEDLHKSVADPDRAGSGGAGWGIVTLRYFNPVGSHPSGRIGEDPTGPPNNLMPYVAQTAVGRRECLTVFGSDYDTPDGTGVRDYIHVMDLAEGHLAALRRLRPEGPPPAPMATGHFVYNLGTGKGISVLEMVAAMEKASGKVISKKIGARRPGDIATCYASTDKAEAELGWKATRGVDEMCADLWRWQSANPNGYAPTASE